jgi:hypothetical protein
MQSYKNRVPVAAKSNTAKIVIIFLFAAGLRAIPELFSGAYPVGFDTMQGYAPSILALPDDSPMKLFGWAYSPLAIYLLGSVYELTKINVYLLLKIAGPIFYGIFSATFYYLLTHGLKWSTRKSLLVTFILILQPAILRMGWDQFREELGLSFFFILLGVTKCDIVSSIKKKSAALLVLTLSLLIVFSHQLAAILLFAVVLWQLLTYETKRGKAFVTSILVIVPSVLIFAWQINGQFLNPMYDIHFSPLQLPNGASLFPFTNYFLSDPRFIGGNYLTILSHVGSLLLFSIMPLIPFAIKGFSKDKVFLPMLIWLTIASFSILVYPWFALQMYWWWILLLPIPLTIYLGGYLEKAQVFENKKFCHRKKIFIVLFVIGLLAVAYTSSAVKVVYLDAITYMPSGMVESSIEFTDTTNVKLAITWANQNIPPNSILIIQEKIQGLSYSEMRHDFQIRVSPSLLTLNQAINLIPAEACIKYAIWYKEDLNHQTFAVAKIAEFGKIGIFQISG